MPNIKKVELTAKTIKGLQVRTENTDEMNPDTYKTDFEHYISKDEAEIFIGVNYL